MKTKSLAQLKKDLWKVFALYVKKRDEYICFTCGKYCEGANANAGHFIPKSAGGLALYFHEDNVHCQCVGCNLFLQGNQYVYGQKLGEEKVKELYKLKQQTVKWTQQDYLDKIKQYKELYEHLG